MKLAECFSRRVMASLLVVFVAAGAFYALASAEKSDGEKPEAALAQGEKAARLLSQIIPRAHLFHQEIGDGVAGRAMDLFLNSLDFDHSFFLASDIEEFRREAPRLDDMLKEGDLSFALKAYERYRERVKDRVAYVDVLLKKEFDLTVKETFRWKRKDAPWAANEEEWNELWRKKVKNEYVARIVAVKTADEKEKDEAAKPAPRGGDKKEEEEVVKDRDALKDLHLTPEEFIRKRYKQFLTVMEDSDEEFAIDRYLTSFTQAFDPHSEYMSPARTEDFDINMKLSLVGIGAQLSSEDGAAKIERLIPGGPADRDGRLKPGDRIVGVGQGEEPPVDILHWPLYKAVRIIRGEKGTPVTLVVWPSSDLSGGTEKRIRIVRDEVKLEEQAAKGKTLEIDGPDGRPRKLGVITLPEFYADFKAAQAGGTPRRCVTDVRKILADLREENVAGIALDLRNNGGGSLPDAIELAGLFVRSGPVVQVKDARNVQVLSDPDPDLVYDGPLVVLVNRMSASASEIVAAALQDYGRAAIIGDRKTHGKGSVQTLLPLQLRGDSLGSYKVTTANFYRIAGGSTQLKGVSPDIVIPSLFDRMELGEEYLPNAMPWSVVDPAFYAILLHQVPPLDVLREKSERRRAEDAAYKTRAELMERLGKRLNAEEISLNLEERIAMARQDRELDEQQKALGGDDADKKDEKKDLVLMESLRVLSDIVAWRDARRSGAENVAAR